MGATMGDRQCCSEVFTNCAEVKLVGKVGPVPSPMPTSTPVPPTTTTIPISATPAPTVSITTTIVSSPAPSGSEPEPEPEPDSRPVTCIATPGLNRGVSDADCARCENGYQWWPCNEDILCQCTNTGLVQAASAKVTIKRAGASSRRSAFLHPDHAMLQVAYIEGLRDEL